MRVLPVCFHSLASDSVRQVIFLSHRHLPLFVWAGACGDQPDLIAAVRVDNSDDPSQRVGTNGDEASLATGIRIFL